MPSKLHPRLLVESQPIDPMPRWASRIVIMAEHGEIINRLLYTREGHMKFVLPDAQARMMVDAGIITAEQVILSQPMPMMDVPKAEVNAPRNRHERRRQAKQRSR